VALEGKNLERNSLNAIWLRRSRETRKRKRRDREKGLNTGKPARVLSIGERIEEKPCDKPKFRGTGDEVTKKFSEEKNTSRAGAKRSTTPSVQTHRRQQN